MSGEPSSLPISVENTAETNLHHLILTHTSRIDNLVKMHQEEREAMQKERQMMQDLMGLMKDAINGLDLRDTEQRTRVAALARVEQRMTSNLDRMAVQVKRLTESIDRKG